MSLISQLFGILWNIPLLVYVISGLIITWYFLNRRPKYENIPPTPEKPYPLLGHFPLLRGNVLETLHKWRKTKGDIYSIYLGPHLAVVLSGWDVMKEMLVKKGEHFSGRPTTHTVSRDIKDGGRVGIITNVGEPWKETRSVSTQILREMGMGKDWLSEKVIQEVQVYLEELSSLNGQAKDVRLLTNSAVANVITAILIGHRLDYQDQDFVYLLNLLNEQVVLLSSTGLLQAFPFVQHLPGDLFKAKKSVNIRGAIRTLFAEKFITQINETGEDNNFIATFLKKMDKKKERNIHTNLEYRNLIQVISDLFAAGGETTGTTILWALLFSLRHPETQDKLHQEILDVIGIDRPPTMLDKPNMNYTMAFIMESQRLGSVVPLSLPHVCTKTTEVGGYIIPEGTRIIPNLHEVMHDEKIWENATAFRPERFLNPEGQVVVPEQFVPFSVGRRYCMGESVARMELFLFITSIFQRFKVLPEHPDAPPPADRIFGLTSAPKAYKIRFVER